MPKSSLALKRVATINCRTLAATKIGREYIEDKLMSLTKTMQRLKVDVIFVTETKRNESNFQLNYDDKLHISCFFGPFIKVGGVGFLIQPYQTHL
uniref:Endo/exonuclease/phosphatase domain-containing protein n=1 Tax=Rhabditophanes sp. KR3021 TaxID=114890 RepID=A0AC35UH18_9BILA